jgi:transposase-like protein
VPTRRSATSPPFCPNPVCDSRSGSGPWRFKRKGFFRRAHPPRKVQRYLCQRCRRNFSAQTFRTTYWLRHPGLLEPLFHRLVGCSGYRQIARELQVSHSTVRRQAERLGRHCLLFHEKLRPREAPREPVVLDGFRTFEHSQYWPLDVHLLVGTSHYVYAFNDAELRRSGSMRPAQRRKRALLEKRHGRPDPQAPRKRVEELLRRTVPPGGSLHLLSDDHAAYPRALKRLRDRHFRHETTPSRQARTPTNPLFPVNLADLLLRHSSANHKRETIAFSKRRQGMLYRLAVWVVWRNYLKSVSENRKDPPPAQQLGVIERALTLREILARRRFPDRARLSGWLADCYFGRIPTRAIRNCAAHTARYAV